MIWASLPIKTLAGNDGALINLSSTIETLFGSVRGKSHLRSKLFSLTGLCGIFFDESEIKAPIATFTTLVVGANSYRSAKPKASIANLEALYKPKLGNDKKPFREVILITKFGLGV